MIFYDIAQFIGRENITVVDAMKLIDHNASGALIIVDNDGCLRGAISDGDIRRWLINDGKLDTQISNIMNTSPKYVYEEEKNTAGALLKKYQISIIPIIDKNRCVVGIVKADIDASSNIRSNALANVPIVIMAGGKGTRLYPYTKILPKPLIPINDIPIVERVINEFCRYGASSFTMTLNYKKEMIKSYFKESDPEYELNYIEESKPLGTAGALTALAGSKKSPMIVTNCDILVRADYDDLYRYHVDSGNAMTVVSAIMKTTIPYGVLNTGDEGLISSVDEKPSINYAANTGMYVINTEYLDLIPKDTFYHMTDFMDELIKRGERVGMYPISEESFLDMGEFAEMQRMEDKLKDNLN